MARMLFLNHNWFGQGTFLRCYNLGRQLVALGHEITLVTVSADARYRADSVREHGLLIIRTPFAFGGHYQSGGWGILDIVHRLVQFGRSRFDLVYAFDHRPNVSLPALCHKYFRHTPLVSDWADWWCDGGLLDFNVPWRFPFQYGIERFLEREMKVLSAGVTVISEALGERARRLGIPGDRMLLLHSGADIERIVPLPKERTRIALGIPGDMKIAGYIAANLIDTEILMRGVAKLFERRKDCRLMYIGPDRGWHRDLARTLKIDDRIIWTGFQPYARIGEFIACADIMLLPLRDTPVNRGRWPNKMGEYMAGGKATVTCAVGEMKPLLSAHRVGVLAEPNEEDFAEQASRLLDDARAAEEMGRAARTLAEREYSWRSIGERVSAFLAGVLDRPGVPDPH